MYICFDLYQLLFIWFTELSCYQVDPSQKTVNTTSNFTHVLDFTSIGFFYPIHKNEKFERSKYKCKMKSSRGVNINNIYIFRVIRDFARNTSSTSYLYRYIQMYVFVSTYKHIKCICNIIYYICIICNYIRISTCMCMYIKYIQYKIYIQYKYIYYIYTLSIEFTSYELLVQVETLRVRGQKSFTNW